MVDLDATCIQSSLAMNRASALSFILNERELLHLGILLLTLA